MFSVIGHEFYRLMKNSFEKNSMEKKKTYEHTQKKRIEKNQQQQHKNKMNSIDIGK